jgi:hypothetical protein|uniref:DUF5679 domain-containing protein n=1 Tax=viral metagenome TaxID=1070528 RepID=A0A6C0CZL1_9ZZZZ
MPAKLQKKLKEQEFYCVSCRKRVKIEHDDICVDVIKNKKVRGGIPALRGICQKCDANVIKFIKVDKKAQMVDKYGRC